jgi:acyl-CoA dehydrogenase
MGTVLLVIAIVLFGFYNAPLWLWGATLYSYGFVHHWPTVIQWIILLTTVIGSIKPLRQKIVSKPLIALMKKLNIVPSISDTEKTAIEAGTAWVEKEFFNGNPNLDSMLKEPLPTLTPDEQKFLDNQVETLCQMVDDWKHWKTRVLPTEVWNYIRKEKFLGLIIPKEYGGLEFSPFAHSEVIRKIASRSLAVAIYVMVPNSLGPAELLMHYGTDEQKKRLLPKLADGTEIPCFGLTEPMAGSDAGSVHSNGVLYKKDGVLMIRLNWNKRYITLAKISTLIGLAFRLKDPENFLGKGPDLGITCALIPANTPGVVHEHQHDPLGVPFTNCPMHGTNVEIEAANIIGGVERAGHGWQMLMECLGAGRGISFPAQVAGGAGTIAQVTASHAYVRQQFGVSVGRFEGVQKPLARVIGFQYLLEALRLYTSSALNQGIKPAIVTAMSKYYSTEHSRKMVNDAMDILGGSGISLGPKNKIAHYYIAAPVGITVEGANILTRSLMIFGQGVFRGHPFAFAMIDALEKNDLVKFDASFFGLVGHGVHNAFRSVLLSLTRGWLDYPFRFSKEAKYFRRISWASASFAILTDFAMGSQGGKLKFKESLTGRLADIMSYLYLATSVLRKYEADGKRAEDWPVAQYALEHVMGEVQIAFEETFLNLKLPLYTWAKLNPFARPIRDKLVARVAEDSLTKPELLDRHTEGLFVPKDSADHQNQLRAAADLLRQVEPIQRKVHHALKAMGKKKVPLVQAMPDLLKNNSITAPEAALLQRWDDIKEKVILVDEFTEEQYLGKEA